jgi:DNA-binding NarL/FixJ family response regulator
MASAAPAPLEKDQSSASIVIADDRRMNAQLLKNELMRSRYRFAVVASVTSQAELFESLTKHSVDVALINEDLEEGPSAGFRVLPRLREAYPKTRVVLLLKSATRDLVVDAFRGGVKGVFCRSDHPEALSKCVSAVQGGQIWANSMQIQFVVEALIKAKPLRITDIRGQKFLLTKREDEVANLVAEGLANVMIADKLDLTEHTVSNYLFRIYEKLGISSRVELVLYVLKQRQG